MDSHANESQSTKKRSIVTDMTGSDGQWKWRPAIVRELVIIAGNFRGIKFRGFGTIRGSFLRARIFRGVSHKRVYVCACVPSYR